MPHDGSAAPAATLIYGTRSTGISGIVNGGGQNGVGVGVGGGEGGMGLGGRKCPPRHTHKKPSSNHKPQPQLQSQPSQPQPQSQPQSHIASCNLLPQQRRNQQQQEGQCSKVNSNNNTSLTHQPPSTYTITGTASASDQNDSIHQLLPTKNVTRRTLPVRRPRCVVLLPTRRRHESTTAILP